MTRSIEATTAARTEWIELALDYRCNLRCVGCRACEDLGERIEPAGALAILRDARTRGIPNLWIGGGEPTLRPELLALVAAARRLGFERVLVQTNGLRLAYAGYADALLAAGTTDLSFNLKSCDPAVHDALGRAPGSHALLASALVRVAGRGARIAADVLLARSTLASLPATIAWGAERGVERFTLWLLSAADTNDADVSAEVPSFAELRMPVAEAAAVAQRRGVSLASLHTPPCTLPAEHRARYLPAAALRLRVVDPSGRSFPLERSPFEGGVWLDECARCAARPSCAGLRADHLALHAPAGIRAIEPGEF